MWAGKHACNMQLSWRQVRILYLWRGWTVDAVGLKLMSLFKWRASTMDTGSRWRDVGQTTQERLVISPSVNTWPPPPLWQGAILARKLSTELWRYGTTSEARFKKYLTTILRLSYDNAEVTIDLRRTSNLSNILRRTQGLDTIYLRIHKIVWDSVRKLIYDIPKRNLGTL